MDNNTKTIQLMKEAEKLLIRVPPEYRELMWNLETPDMVCRTIGMILIAYGGKMCDADLVQDLTDVLIEIQSSGITNFLEALDAIEFTDRFEHRNKGVKDSIKQLAEHFYRLEFAGIHQKRGKERALGCFLLVMYTLNLNNWDNLHIDERHLNVVRDSFPFYLKLLLNVIDRPPPYAHAPLNPVPNHPILASYLADVCVEKLSDMREDGFLDIEKLDSEFRKLCKTTEKGPTRDIVNRMLIASGIATDKTLASRYK